MSALVCRARGASPFGILLGPVAGSAHACPFPSWDYLPGNHAGSGDPDCDRHDAGGTDVGYIDRACAPVDAPAERRQPLEHPSGLSSVAGVRLVCPKLRGQSITGTMAERKSSICSSERNIG